MDIMFTLRFMILKKGKPVGSLNHHVPHGCNLTAVIFWDIIWKEKFV